MKFSKLLRGFPLAAFVLCAVFGVNTGPLLADGTVAPRSFQSGGVSAAKVEALSALANPNPAATPSPQATNKSLNKNSLRRALVLIQDQVLVQACKPPGAACSLPGECCSNSCVPPGFGGEPTCR